MVKVIAVLMLIVCSPSSALASDWVEDADAVTNAARTVDSTPQAQPQMSYAQPLNPIGTSGLQLNLMQAMRALEYEVFGKDSTRKNMEDRLEALEKAVFGSQPLPDLDNSMARLERLLHAAPLSLSSIEKVSPVPAQHAASMNRVSLPDQRHGGLLAASKRLLASPTFWELIGAAGVVFGAYELARHDAILANNANPYSHYVNGYWRADGHFVHGYWATDADGTTLDNYSYPGNYNPHTGTVHGLWRN